MKTYKKPSIEIVKIQTMQMLAGSPTEQPKDEGAVAPGMGRYFDFDDEEEY